MDVNESNWISQSTCIVLVYDITNRDSFEMVKQKYLPAVQKYLGPNCFVLLIGNKMDLTD